MEPFKPRAGQRRRAFNSQAGLFLLLFLLTLGSSLALGMAVVQRFAGYYEGRLTAALNGQFLTIR